MARRAEKAEPQFPAPWRDFSEPVDEEERLAGPSPRAQAVMAEHVRSHGIEPFELERHVYLGPPRRPSQILTWYPASARFECELCPGWGYSTGEITKERIEREQLFNENLRPFIAGPHSAAEREQITRAFISGGIGRELARASAKLERRRPALDKRPVVAEQRARVQAWMLERFVVRGVVERVIEEALEMQRNDLTSWLAIAGKHRAASTLRRDWQQIDDERIEAAKRAYAERRR